MVDAGVTAEGNISSSAFLLDTFCSLSLDYGLTDIVYHQYSSCWSI